MTTGGTDPSTMGQPEGVRISPTRFEVRVTGGPDAGASLVVSPRSAGKLLVGTAPTCHLRLTDRRVSRRHLALDVGPLGLRVTDAGSTNGTRVDGLSIVDAFCRGGETLSIGDTTLQVSVDHADAESPDVRMSFGPLVGASLAMRRLYRTCDALALSRAPLLVEGETGTGKMLLAEALHAASGEEAPFVVVEGPSLDAAALADENELLEGAAAGTLVVRAVEKVSLDAQTPLARIIAMAKSRDVRVVMTARANVDAAVEAGTFREELAREIAARIELPPLRERRGDIALLVEHTARTLGSTSASIPPKKLAALNRHDFVENVRELLVTVASLLADAGAPISTAKAGDLPPASPEALGLELGFRDILLGSAPFAEAKQKVFDRFATAYVTWMVARHGGHVARAAAASGLAPRYFNILRARGRERP